MKKKITIKKIKTILKKNLATLLATAFLCFGGAFAFMRLAVSPNYYTTADFLLVEKASKEIDATENRLLAETFVQILDTDRFFATVRKDLPADLIKKYSVQDLHGSASFSTVNGTEIIRLTFNLSQKSDVSIITNAIIKAVPTYISGIYGELECKTVEGPLSPEISTAKASVIGAIAAVAGFIVAFVSSLLKDILDVYVRTASQLAERYSVPILGSVPEFNRNKKKGGAKK
ncbi:MAG: hypothetical protein IKM22_04160 [Clostridia bacterium]|nr:hypothetical protein [Clostridia bacterium]